MPRRQGQWSRLLRHARPARCPGGRRTTEDAGGPPGDRMLVKDGGLYLFKRRDVEAVPLAVGTVSR